MNEHNQSGFCTEREKEMMLVLKVKLSALLKQHGITATKLGKDCGIAKQVICDWLAGVEPRSLCKVKRVALYFGVSLDELCFIVPRKEQDDEINLVSDRGGGGHLIASGTYELVLKKIPERK